VAEAIHHYGLRRFTRESSTHDASGHRRLLRLLPEPPLEGVEVALDVIDLASPVAPIPSPLIESAAHAQVGDLSLAYRSAGSGPPLVLLHGFLCDSRAWRCQLEGLADSFRVIAWDAPGAGKSSDPPDRFTITDWAESLAGFLDVLGVRDGANLVGLSWGGLLAQEFYRLHPSRVGRLVLAGTYAGWKGSFGEEVARQRLQRCDLESRLAPDEFVARWVPVEFFADASAELAAEMAAVVSDFHPAGFRLMAAALADADTTKLLERIAVPVLLLWGDADGRSPVDVALRFERLVSGAQLVLIRGAGHVSNMERPEEFNAAVRGFCQATEVD
jgi:pimeloyl-ACP methyl ester carboxylesterase